MSWPGSYVEMAIERAEAAGLGILAVHSHPGGLFAFSDLDDASDELLLPALFHGTDAVAGSAIMLPDGAMRGRLYGADKITKPIDLISVIGDDLRFWWQQDARPGTSARKRPVAFTSGMTEWLGRLSVCIIGVSGTGSVVAEQLARMQKASLAASGMLTWPALTTFTGLAQSSSRSRKASRSSGANWSAAP